MKAFLLRNQTLILGLGLAVTIILVTALAAAGAAPVTAAPAAPVITKVARQDQPTAFWMRVPCEYEDSSNCYWAADARGNRIGHSFYVRNMPGPRTCIFFTERRYAQKHDRCFPDQV